MLKHTRHRLLIFKESEGLCWVSQSPLQMPQIMFVGLQQNAVSKKAFFLTECQISKICQISFSHQVNMDVCPAGEEGKRRAIMNRMYSGPPLPQWHLIHPHKSPMNGCGQTRSTDMELSLRDLVLFFSLEAGFLSVPQAGVQ